MTTGEEIDNEDRPKVYLETSFMFYLTGRETTDQKIASEQAYTRKWWEVERPQCRVFTSSFVIQESNGRDPEYVERRNEKIAETEVLQTEDELIFTIAAKLLEGKALPKDETTDAYHIATAAVHGMDYLLSWNCRHLANPQTYPKTKKIVESFGLICPSIITPRSYLEDFTNAK